MLTLEEFGESVKKCGVNDCGCQSQLMLGVCQSHHRALKEHNKRFATHAFWIGMIIGTLLVGLLTTIAINIGAIG